MSNSGLSNGAMRDRFKRMTAGVRVASLTVLLTSCSEEPRPCLPIGCPTEALTLRVEAAHWESGAYVVAITASGRTFECRFERGTDGGGGQAGSPNDPGGGVQRCEQVSGTNTADVPQWWGVEDVTISMNPEKQLSISVRRDGTTLLEQELSPRTVRSEPGGPGCAECFAPEKQTLTLPAEEH